MSNRYTEPSWLSRGFYRWVYDPLRASYFRGLVAGLELAGDERVLDIGSGPGSEAEHLARALARGGRVTCLDVSPAWLAEARRRLAAYANVDYVLGEAVDVGLPAGTFDLALAHYVLHDMDRQKLPATVAALAAALRPGGRFVVVEPDSQHGLTAEELDPLMSAVGLVRESSVAVRSLGGSATKSVFVCS